jgi:predicted glutamine amidotransferase
MCVIINRDPNVEIEFEKIKSACAVNPHGFGLMFAEDGALNVIKDFSDKGNDPEKVARLLDDYKDYRVSLHLRYMTVGAKNVDNCHPYWTCTREDDEIDVGFMHNGTLGDFRRKDSNMSDSYHFNEEIIRPLFLRFAAYDLESNVLRDPLFGEILAKYCGTTSVFNLMDSEGNILVINEERGIKKNGWWASNDYSFNRFHRDPPKTSSNTTKGGWYYNGKFYERDYHIDGSVFDKPKSNSTTLPPAVDKKTSTPTQVIKEVTDIEPPTSRETFIEVAQLSSIEEVVKFNEDDIEELIETYPEYAKLLIQDLIYALYVKESDNATTSNLAAVNG